MLTKNVLNENNRWFRDHRGQKLPTSPLNVKYEIMRFPTLANTLNCPDSANFK